MGIYFLMWNVGTVNKGRSETSRSFYNLDKAKNEAKKISKELDRGVRIYKDIGLISSNGNYTKTR